MNIFVTGVNYKTAPLDTREKFSFTVSEQKQMVKEMTSLPGVAECVLISTCNRTEIYIYSDNCAFDNETAERLLCQVKQLSLYDYKKYFYFYSSMRAIRHLFKVASGLDSMVLGEDQILGQVKGACELAMEMEASGSILNALFREAVTAAKKVKTFTGLSKNSVSVATLAIKLVWEHFEGKVDQKSALVIGAGKIGVLALKNMISRGIKRIYLTNRTHGKALDLSGIHDSIRVVDYNDRYSVMDECDIVVSSTTSPHYTITRDMLEKSLRDGRQRLFIDLAVPRDIDVTIRELEGVRYYNMDDLQLTVEQNLDKRLLEVSRAEEILDEHILAFEKWYEFRGVLSVIKEVQKYTSEVLDEKISQTLSRLKCASEEDREIVKAAISNTVNGIMNTFIYNMREHGSKEELETYFKCLKEAVRKVQ
jgi:glutamyl-tRNA reductase